MSLVNRVVIRPAAPADLPLVRLLFLEYAEELGVDLHFQNFDQELDALPGKYAPPDGFILMAWSADECAGCIALKPLESGRCEMKRLYVRPQFRKLGVGRNLATECIRLSQSSYREMVLDTLPSLGPAIELYRSIGFKDCLPYYGNPIPRALFMHLDLSRAPTQDR